MGHYCYYNCFSGPHYVQVQGKRNPSLICDLCQTSIT